MSDTNKENRPVCSCGKTSLGCYQCQITPSAIFLAASLGRTVPSSLAHDLNKDGPLPTGAGTRKPISTYRVGRSLVLLLDPKGQSAGGSSMPNFSEWPNDAAVSFLSEVLEKDSIPQKYYSSSAACAGILNRSEKRKRQLPPLLRMALEHVASTTTKDKPDT